MCHIPLLLQPLQPWDACCFNTCGDDSFPSQYAWQLPRLTASRAHGVLNRVSWRCLELAPTSSRIDLRTSIETLDICVFSQISSSIEWKKGSLHMKNTPCGLSNLIRHGCSWVQKPTDHGLGTLGWCVMWWHHFRWRLTTFDRWFSSQNSCFPKVFAQALHHFSQGTCGAELSAQGLFGAPNTTDLWSSWFTAYYGGRDEIAQHSNIVPWSFGTWRSCFGRWLGMNN